MDDLASITERNVEAFIEIRILDLASNARKVIVRFDRIATTRAQQLQLGRR